MITGASLFTDCGTLLFTDYNSLLGSCKAAGVNPSEWLEDVLSKIYSYAKEGRNLEGLLPHLWKK